MMMFPTFIRFVINFDITRDDAENFISEQFFFQLQETNFFKRKSYHVSTKKRKKNTRTLLNRVSIFFLVSFCSVVFRQALPRVQQFKCVVYANAGNPGFAYTRLIITGTRTCFFRSLGHEVLQDSYKHQEIKSGKKQSSASSFRFKNHTRVSSFFTTICHIPRNYINVVITLIIYYD